MMTAAGALIFVTGVAYLFTVGRRLIPERVHPEADFADKYRMGAYMGRVRVPEGSALVGRELRETQRAESFDLDVLQIVRGDRVYLGPTTDQTVEAGDLMFEIEDGPFRAAVALARANVERAQATVTETEAALARSRTLAERGNVSEATLDEAEAAFRRATSLQPTSPAPRAM